MVLVSTVLITFSGYVTKFNVLIGVQNFCCQYKWKWLYPPDVFLQVKFWPARLPDRSPVNHGFIQYWRKWDFSENIPKGIEISKESSG